MDQKHQKGSPQETVQMIQCGNLDLNFPIKYGILLLGNTKSGKTTTSHYLMHQILKGGYNDHNSVVYKLQAGQEKFSNARIGDSQSQSETQIPNFFDFQQNGEKYYLIDCPGYLDTFGYYRIISNRFFHFQVFSKVQKIKFIITFPFFHMIKTADQMTKAFQQFLQGFTKINQIQNELIDSISIMVTCVPADQDLQTVKKRYEGTPNRLRKQLLPFYTKLKKSIIDNNRIFLFHNAILGANCNYQNKILKSINSATKFWERQVNRDGEVDMKNIQISIDQYSNMDEQTFSQELNQFKNFYMESFKNSDIKNFIEVISTLITDNERDADSYQCIKKMQKFSQEKQAWRQKNSKCFQLYKKYSQKRNQLKEKLFSGSKLFNSEVNLAADIPFWLLKIKSLLKIQKISYNFYDKKNNRGYQQLVQKANAVIEIINILVSLTKGKKLKDSKQDKLKNEQIIDYLYQFYKIIDISNKIYRLINKSSNQKFSQHIKEGVKFILVDYPILFQDVFLKPFRQNLVQAFIKKFQNVKIQDNLTKKGLIQVVNFFEEYKREIIQLEKNKEIKISNWTIQKAIDKLDNKISQLNVNQLKQIKRQNNPKLSMLKEIQDNRLKICSKIQSCNGRAVPNQQLTAEHNRLVHIMADYLIACGKNQVALQLYECLHDADMILELMQKKQAMLKIQDNQNLLLAHYINYMNKAKKYLRRELAIQKAQKAYHIAQETANIEKINEIRRFFKDIYEADSSVDESYLQVVAFQFSHANIPKQLSDKIIELSKSK